MYLTKSKRFAVSIVGIILACLVDSLLSSIQSFGSFDMQGNLDASSDEFAWIGILYISFKLMAFMSGSYILERYNILRVLKVSILLLVICCFLSANSTNLEIQYIFSIIQGFSGGILLLSSQSFLFQNFPKKYQPFIQAFFALGAVIAPATFLIGYNGYMLNNYTWEFVFLTTVPIGLLSLIILTIVEEKSFELPEIRKIDFIGIIIFALFVFPFVFIISRGNRYNWFEDINIAFFTVFSLVFLAIFIIRTIIKSNTLININIFKINLFSFGIVVSLAAGAALFGSTTVINNFGINVLGFTLEEHGRLLFFSGFMFILSVFFTAFIVEVLGIPPFKTIAFGLLGFCISMYFFSKSNINSGLDELYFPILLRGLAVGLLFLSLTLIAINNLPKKLIPYGIGVFSTTRQLGGNISIAVLTTLIKDDTATNLNIISSHVTQNSTNVANWLSVQADKIHLDTISNQSALSLVSKAVNSQVSVLTYSNAFLYLICLIVLAIPCIITTKKLLFKFNPPKNIHK